MAGMSEMLNTEYVKRVLDAALVCAGRPLTLTDMQVLFNDAVGLDTLRGVLDDLTKSWEGKGLELVTLKEGWRLQSRPHMQEYLERLQPRKTHNYTRAALETLAVIAYRQPVTRSAIEEIRGVGVSPAILDQFETRGWIEIIGKQNSPGMPALYATTFKFLDDLGLNTLEDLPTIWEPEVQATLIPPEEDPDWAGADLVEDAPSADAVVGPELPLDLDGLWPPNYEPEELPASLLELIASLAPLPVTTAPTMQTPSGGAEEPRLGPLDDIA
jgi:segregation and condensation protein B